jgi:hypothetical protein
MAEDMQGQLSLVRIAEAARLAGVAPKTVRRWAAKGRISLDRSGAQPQVPVAELLRIGVLDKVGPEGHSRDTGQGHAGPLSRNVPDMRDIDRDTELAVLRAEKRRLEEAVQARDDEVRWLRGRIEHLEATVGQLALPPARPEEAPAQPPGRASRWARFAAWFWGRNEGA